VPFQTTTFNVCERLTGEGFIAGGRSFTHKRRALDHR
jgi:hypothetical protein